MSKIKLAYNDIMEAENDCFKEKWSPRKKGKHIKKKSRKTEETEEIRKA